MGFQENLKGLSDQALKIASHLWDQGFNVSAQNLGEIDEVTGQKGYEKIWTKVEKDIPEKKSSSHNG